VLTDNCWHAVEEAVVDKAPNVIVVAVEGPFLVTPTQDCPEFIPDMEKVSEVSTEAVMVTSSIIATRKAPESVMVPAMFISYEFAVEGFVICEFPVELAVAFVPISSVVEAFAATELEVQISTRTVEEAAEIVVVTPITLWVIITSPASFIFSSQKFLQRWGY